MRQGRYDPRAAIQRQAATILLKRRLIASKFLEHLKFVWWKSDPLVIGLHTLAVCQAIDEAINQFEQGISSFLLFQMPFRHGKSDLVSRALPGYFMGRCHRFMPDLILSGYGTSLAEELGEEAMNIMESDAYRKIFPHIRIRKRSKKRFKLEGSSGVGTIAGLGGSITGKGGHLNIVDDYCKSREEAESPTYRNKTWSRFSDDLLTRRAPVSINIVTATPWHIDDVAGRIKKHMREVPGYPRFRVYNFPASAAKALEVGKVYPSKYLMPGRFSDEWYESQYATLSKYSAAGLLDCDPRLRDGNLFQCDVGTNIHIHDSLSEFPDCSYFRFWDLASSKEERTGDDPDWTVGVLFGGCILDGKNHLWIKDIQRFRHEAPRRDTIIRETAETDGGNVRIGIEAQAAYKDAYNQIRAALKGKRVVQKVTVSKDLVARSTKIETMLSDGNVHLLRAPWNDALVDELLDFPDGSHDDQIAAITGGWELASTYLSGQQSLVRSEMGF